MSSVTSNSAYYRLALSACHICGVLCAEMKLIIKVLKGPDCPFDVSPDTNVLDLKRKVSDRLSVSVDGQRLVYRGKALPDDKSVAECGLQDGNKIFLVLKKGEELPAGSIREPNLDLWTEILKVLRRHFVEDEARRVLEEVKRDFHHSVDCMSLDDIERLATATLEKSS